MIVLKWHARASEHDTQVVWCIKYTVGFLEKLNLNLLTDGRTECSAREVNATTSPVEVDGKQKLVALNQ